MRGLWICQGLQVVADDLIFYLSDAATKEPLNSTEVWQKIDSSLASNLLTILLDKGSAVVIL